MSNEYKDWVRDCNEELLDKYPFLKVNDTAKDVTWLDLIPYGWQIGFGEKMCEELKNALGPWLYDWEIYEMKEKYGELRIYHGGEVPDNIFEDVNDVIEKYEGISYITCAKCGEYFDTHIDGWALPLCNECVKKIQ